MKVQPKAHPERVLLHNEIHARPPQALAAPLVVAHVVMVCDAAERQASRAHLATLLRDHHLPQPDAQCVHMRMDLGPFAMRWEMHTEFVTWTFSRPFDATGFSGSDPAKATAVVPADWLAQLPGRMLAGLNLWVIAEPIGAPPPRALLAEDTLVASRVASGEAEVYTDFALHADGFARMVLRAGGISPRGLGRLVQQLLEIDTYRMTALLGLPAARDASSVLGMVFKTGAEKAVERMNLAT